MAVESMKSGAFDYLTKPFKIDELVQTVRHALEYQIARTENIDLQAQLEHRDHAEKLDGIVTGSSSMLQVCNKIDRFAPSDRTVLIYGEKGSGKTLVARTLHHYSLRKHKPFTVVNCKNLPDPLMGKDPFNITHDGTLFLDEISALPLDFQAQLIAFLQDNTVPLDDGSHHTKINIRIIAASHEKLEPLIEQGRFHKDLHQHLSGGSTIDIPPLRNRPEDILPLVHQTMHQNLGADVHIPMLDHETTLILDHYTWPGNVRELEESILHALGSMQDGMITIDDLPTEIVAVVKNDLYSGGITTRSEQFIGRSVKAFLHNKKNKLLEQVSNPPEDGDGGTKDVKPPDKASDASCAKEDRKDVWGLFDRTPRISSEKSKK